MFAQQISANPTAYINNFKIVLKLNKNSSMTVVENIDLVSDGTQVKHGITRFLPTAHTNMLDDSQIVSYRIISVLMDNNAVPYQQKYTSKGIVLYIGSEDKLLPAGEYHYQINYQVMNAIHFLKDRDQLYWNAFGFQWQFPILHPSLDIKLPNGLTSDLVSAHLFVGTPDSMQVVNNFPSLQPGQGALVVLTMPKGYIQPMSILQTLEWHFTNNALLIILSLLIVIFSIYTWIIMFLKGKSWKNKNTIIPQYSAPDGLSPVECGYILNMQYTDKLFTVFILQLAVKGYLVIQKTKNYLLTKRSAFAGDLTSEEKTVTDILFTDQQTVNFNGYQPSVTAANSVLKRNLKLKYQSEYFTRYLKEFFFSIIPGTVLLLIALGLLFKQADDQQMYGLVSSLIAIALPTLFIIVLAITGSNPIKYFIQAIRNSAQNKIKWSTLLAASVGIFVGVLTILSGLIIGMLSLNTLGKLIIALTVYSVILNCILYIRLRYPTEKGLKVINEILGFKLYLQTAEKDRLNMLNPPEQTPALFESLLPYAFALGVDQQWSEQFASVLDFSLYQPDWNDRNPLTLQYMHGFYIAFQQAKIQPVEKTTASFSTTSSKGDGGGGGGAW